MREPRFWLYKWNAKEKEGKKFTGLWVDYLKEPLLTTVFTGYGFEGRKCASINNICNGIGVCYL
jgi:hypothetical protein